MERQKLKQIVADVLEVEPAQLTSVTSLKSFPTYDSVAVLMLMVAMDEKASVKLTPSDTRELQSFGDIERLVERKGIRLEGQ